MNTYKIIITGILCSCAVTLHAQTNAKAEPTMPKTTISKTETPKPAVPGGEYKHPGPIQPIMDPAMEIKESVPVLPDPGKENVLPTEDIAPTVPVYPASSKVVNTTKPAEKPRNN